MIIVVGKMLKKKISFFNELIVLIISAEEQISEYSILTWSINLQKT